MKIISKYKDYYDYLKGIYGEDNKLILDRRKGTIVTPHVSSYSDKNVWRLYICGRILEFIDVKGKFYFGEDIAPFSEEVKPWLRNENVKYIIQEYKYQSDRDKIFYPELSEDIHNLYTFKEIPCPIFLFSIDYRGDTNVNAIYPRLTDMCINKVVPAHDLWLMLSQWLAENLTKREPYVPIGDDTLRIESHGFDLKNSFRNTKNRMI